MRASHVIKKLQSAINQQSTNVKILVNTRQWFSPDKGRPVTIYSIREAVLDSDDKKATYELFTTYSQIQAVLFLRDYWYKLNGWEIPKDNATWEEVKNEQKLHTRIG